MKAILVIDEMPKNCDECRLNIEGICGATDERIYSIRCPLKPLPKKMTPVVLHQCIEDEYLYQKGWNDCLKEIEE